jgi:putative ABC transport system substrate-binding protein
MIVPSVALFSITRARIIAFAAKNHIPTVYGEEIFSYDGGLMSYGASVADMNRRGAWAVAKVLRGADPANTPIDYNTRFRLVVNLKAAKEQGIKIPALVLDQADEVLK